MDRPALMPPVRIRVLALDLEGTLISDADSVIPRPGLRDFLLWCGEAFERVMLFTCVSEEHVRSIARELVESDAAPDWFLEVACVDWERPYKDLRFVPGAAPEEVLIVDDKKLFIRPDQQAQWISIPRYLHPFADDDTALEELRNRLVSFAS